MFRNIRYLKSAILFLLIVCLAYNPPFAAMISCSAAAQTLPSALLPMTALFAKEALAERHGARYAGGLNGTPHRWLVRSLEDGIRQTSRRTLLETAAGGILLWLQPARADSVYDRDGVGDYSAQHISFRKLNAAAFQKDPDAQAVWAAVGKFIHAHKAWLNDMTSALHPNEMDWNYTELKTKTMQEWLNLPNHPLQKHLDGPVSKDDPYLWNKLLYQAMPRFLGDRGYIVDIFPSTHETAERVNLFDTFVIFPIRDVQSGPGRRLGSLTEIETDNPVVSINNLVIASAGPGETVAQTIYDSVVYYPASTFEKVARAHMSGEQNVQAKHARVLEMAWSDNLSGSDHFDPISYSGIHLLNISRNLKHTLETRLTIIRRMTRDHEETHIQQNRSHHLHQGPRPDANDRTAFMRWIRDGLAMTEIEAQIMTLLEAARPDLPEDDWYVDFRMRHASLVDAKNTPLDFSNFAITDLMIDVILENPPLYGMTIQESKLYTARAQIVGQLHLLPKPMRAPLMKRVLEEFEAHNESYRFNPLFYLFTPDAKRGMLYDGTLRLDRRPKAGMLRRKVDSVIGAEGRRLQRSP